MKRESILRIGNYEIRYWIEDDIQNCVNNVEIFKDGQWINIKEITGEYLGKEKDECYSMAIEQDGMLAVTTFRGIRFLIDLETLVIVEKTVCK